MPEVTPDLATWENVKEEHDWGALLLGNGASMSVWQSFGYASLFDIATSDAIAHPLGQRERDLFEQLDSVNFEQVLGALLVAKSVNTALNLPADDLDGPYGQIQQALVEAVHNVHVPWMDVPGDALTRMRATLTDFSLVFSANYDLLVYWAMMSEDSPNDFRDYFWGGSFDITNTEVWGKRTRVLWLHGGLHLCRDVWGRTYKRVAGGANLLATFGVDPHRPPLFVTEGTHLHKLRTILSSDYLSFAYHTLSSYDGPLVVFGSSLGEADKHIVEAINHPGRTVAVSLLPGEKDGVKARKAEVLSTLPRPQVCFFDATTHPLGSPDMAVPAGAA